MGLPSGASAATAGAPLSSALELAYAGRHSLSCYRTRPYIKPSGERYGPCGCSNLCAECADISRDLRALGISRR